jgi:hypothetical protein
MASFKKGDRVRYIGDTKHGPYPTLREEHAEGVVLEARKSFDEYRVQLTSGSHKGASLTIMGKSLELADKDPVTPRGAVLREAEKLTTGDRNKTYGSPVENFDVTAAIWTQQLSHKLKPGESFTATDVAILAIQLKMARLRTSPGTRDHYVDIAGYAACGWECQEVEDASA